MTSMNNENMKFKMTLALYSLRIQPPHIRSRYYVRNAKTDVSHVVAGANGRRLYSQAKHCTAVLLLKIDQIQK